LYDPARLSPSRRRASGLCVSDRNYVTGRVSLGEADHERLDRLFQPELRIRHELRYSCRLQTAR
jgi:hypothetical protein